MTGYLPATVQLGDRLRLTPSVLDKQYNGSERSVPPQPLTGVVVYVHPDRRFATVEFRRQKHETMGHWIDASWRECWDIMPGADRLAHKDPPPPKPAKPLTQRLQERDWSGMTSKQIAEVLSTDALTITNAICSLRRKRGIIIPYKKMVDGRPKKRKENQ